MEIKLVATDVVGGSAMDWDYKIKDAEKKGEEKRLVLTIPDDFEDEQFTFFLAWVFEDIH
jgi:hypothetical protein